MKRRKETSIRDQIPNTPVDVYREPIRRNTLEEVTQHPIRRSPVKTSNKIDKSLEEEVGEILD